MKQFGTITLGVLIAMATTEIAFGRDTDAQIELNRASAQAALGEQSVPLLKRTQGPGRASVVDGLLREFSGDLAMGRHSALRRETAEVLRGDTEWFLTVKDDGTAAELWNEDAMRVATQNPKPVQERLSQIEAERVAEAFIRYRLASVVRIAADEELQATSVRYEVQSATDSAGETTGEQVVSARVNFGRTKNGFRILGGGSFVSVTLSNSAEIIGFSFDWPAYQKSAASQPTIGVEAMRQRAAAVGTIRAQETATLERVNCGYYDRGSDRKDAGAPIQAACTVSYSTASRSGGATVRAGYEVVVPLGLTFEADLGWPEAQRLKNPSVSPNETLLKAISPSENQQ